MKKLFFIIPLFFFFSCANQSQDKNQKPESDSKTEEVQNKNLLAKGNIIDIGLAKIQITDISVSDETPVNKVKPKKDENQFLLVKFKINEIEKGKELQSVSFKLADEQGKAYTSPGAWGKIDIGGGLSDFEATDGATMSISKKYEEVKIFFEIPKSLSTNNLSLNYEDKK